ncbi:MAG: non-homologous end-joining DNA ligase [Pseudomonadota bacterium]
MINKQGDSLETYRLKRDPNRTPEPFGGRAVVGASTFVIHHHKARRTHYDLRLAVGDSLWSWAVPKGPSPNPRDKRLAVQVEDHPLEYAVFEGLIPAGNYGAGATIVWDIGRWEPVLDPYEGLQAGKLLFDLYGYKLRGRWTLVRTKSDWLFIKEQDRHTSEQTTDDYPADSVLSGLTIDDWEDKRFPAARIERRLKRKKTPSIALEQSFVPPMLAARADGPFSDPQWVFEIKYDGYRLLAHRHDRAVTLSSRNGANLTVAFPEIELAMKALPVTHLFIDGEIVVEDRQGRPSFSALQQRARLSRRHDIEHAASRRPATLYAIDLLGIEGFDLRGFPLVERKALLKDILPTVGPIRYSEHIAEVGESVFDSVSEMQLEGVVAKRAASLYGAGRSDDWLKIVAEQTDDFVVLGFRRHKTEERFSALILGQYLDQSLRYVGRVGSGFSEPQRRDLWNTMNALPRVKPPPDAPNEPLYRWTPPTTVVEVKFKSWTDAHLVREPRFLRFRDDKPPEDCQVDLLELPDINDDAEAIAFAAKARLSNVSKVYWPADNLTKGDLTKGDLTDYYRDIAPWLLPYLRDRPLVMTRFPDGINGKSFFQHDAPGFTPAWVRTEKIWSGHGEKEVAAFVVNDVEMLLYIINLGCIPLHIWSSRIQSLHAPDWCLLDLDPKGAPFRSVLAIAKSASFSAPITAAALQQFLAAAGMGLGGEDDAAVAK